MVNSSNPIILAEGKLIRAMKQDRAKETESRLVMGCFLAHSSAEYRAGRREEK